MRKEEGHQLRVHPVIDGYDLDFRIGKSVSHSDPPDASESINRYSNGHGMPPIALLRKRTDISRFLHLRQSGIIFFSCVPGAYWLYIKSSFEPLRYKGRTLLR